MPFNLPARFKIDVVKAALGQVAKSNDHKATALGSLAGGLLVADVDWPKLFAGDHQEIGKLVGAAIVALWGFYTNRQVK